MLFHECDSTVFTFIDLFSVQLLVIVPFLQARYRVSARPTFDIVKCVVSHVRFQAGRVEISFSADLANERLLLCVNRHVLFDVDGSGEMLLADRAFDSLLRVDESVSHESSVGGEPLTTDFTDIWVFSGVNDHVKLLPRRSGESHWAELTFVRSNACVGTEVLLQTQLRDEHFS